MEERMKKSLMIIPYIILFAVILYYFVLIPLLMSDKNRTSWRSSAGGQMINIRDLYKEGQYESAAYMIRQIKIKAELCGVSRKEYLECVREIKSYLPAETIDGFLPYDIQEDETNIIFGLCRPGGKGLRGKDREIELHRIADEIIAASEANDRWAYDAYWEKLYEFVRHQCITFEDVEIIRDDIDKYSEAKNN